MATSNNDMWSQWNHVNVSLENRVQEEQVAKNKIQAHLEKILQEIFDVEQNMVFLKKTIADKEAFLQVAQTRLETRTRRPNVEACRDPAMHRLIQEVHDLHSSIADLHGRLRQEENAVQHLLRTKSTLEQDLAVKNNSLFIDSDKVMGIRRTFTMAPPEKSAVTSVSFSHPRGLITVWDCLRSLLAPAGQEKLLVFQLDRWWQKTNICSLIISFLVYTQRTFFSSLKQLSADQQWYHQVDLWHSSSTWPVERNCCKTSSRHQSTDCDQERDSEVLLLTLWLILIEQHSSPRVICVSRNRTFDANHFNELRISAGRRRAFVRWEDLDWFYFFRCTVFFHKTKKAKRKEEKRIEGEWIKGPRILTGH